MTVAKRRLLWWAAGLLVIALPLVLGGSMIWHIGGAHGLDVDGFAGLTDRPAHTFDVGDGWVHYGGDAGGHRYSRAGELTPANVAALAPAWRFHTGDVTRHANRMDVSAAQATPILVEGALIFCTPFNEVIALHPGDGTERWRFDPAIDLNQAPPKFTCRGVTYWRDPTPAGPTCANRIFMGTNDARLIAIDAATGRRCAEFGANGEVRIDPGIPLNWPGEFQITSPPVVLGDVLVVGSSVRDGPRRLAPAGSVRAFDSRTGAPRWTWDPIPRTADNPALASWQGEHPPAEGHANAWAPLSVDERRGLIFVPTSSGSPDHFGGLRPGDNRHANSVVALEAATGTVRWSFQAVHHDVWNYDLPAQPGLYSVWRSGRSHDVVAQVTKAGLVFVLHRDTGEPFLPVRERPVPQGGAEGEALSPTQPFPATPPLVPSTLAPDDAFGLTWLDRQACRRRIAGARSDGLYTPPSEQGTVLYPSAVGGANWGGAAFDPRRNLLVVNMTSIADHMQLIPAADVAAVRAARGDYEGHEVWTQAGTPFGVTRERLVSVLGIPCSPLPWGVLAAVDLDSGRVVWRKPLGTQWPFPALGMPNVGGPIVTAGGLVFVGATVDAMFRAFDVATGAELWRAGLPAPGMATPMTYVWEGRQYVVIYAGGHSRAQTAVADEIVAFALPSGAGG